MSDAWEEFAEYQAEKEAWEAELANEECRRIAETYGRSICDVRWLEGNSEPEIYMAGGVWFPLSVFLEAKGSDE